MNNVDQIPVFELIYVIVNHGMGSKVLHKAKTCGLRGGTVVLGKGTCHNAFLNFLSLYDEKKEIVLLGTDKKTADAAMVQLNKEFHFEKSNHGIMFSTTACNIVGSSCFECKELKEKREENKAMYQFIMAIVNRGKAEDVVEAAHVAGSKGGTIVNARGSGINETSKLFNMDIEPEKEIVMILSKEDVTESIVEAIRDKLNLDEPGNGIVFVQDVTKTYGIYE